jgi:hypothetical protein
MPIVANLALNKPATQSSTSQWSNSPLAAEDARGANNGQISGDYGFHTDREQDPWWQVDLEGDFLIRKVVIFNRKGYARRLRHFSLLGSMDGRRWKSFFSKFDASVFGDDDDRPYVADIAGDQPARFVRVRLDGYECLHFNECQVFGDALDPGTLQRLIADNARAGDAKTKLGIIVPYRNRPEHLAKFLPHLISYFQREKSARELDVTILVSEQADALPFNRGGVLNAGFLALEPTVDYVCFHNVDYLPMWADYSYTEMPTRIIWWGKHLRPIRAQNPTQWIIAAKSGLEAVALVAKEQFRTVNGFSNRFFGWGFEDRDLYERCRLHALDVLQKGGTFIPLDHDNAGFNEDGSKSPAWIENHRRWVENNEKYAARGTGGDGISNFPGVVNPIRRETWSGLDRSESAEILRLQVRFDAGAGVSNSATLPVGRSFDLFDTLIARRCVHPHEIFDIVERMSGRDGFASARRAAEAEIQSDQYTLDDIYRRLAARLGLETDEADRLKALELETEADNLFPIIEHCREVSPNDVVVSDMYLPAEWLMGIVRTICGVAPRALYVSSHGKRRGTAWQTIQNTLRLVEHVGDDPVTDRASAQAAGIPARLTTAARRSAIEIEIAAAGFVPLANLMREARLTTWHDDPAMRRAQIAQAQLNFPLLFLATLHLRNLSAALGWDHILMSGRDCYLWHDLYQRLRPLFPGAPTATYFHTSRVARAHPSPAYLAYFAAQRIGRRNVVVDVCGTGWSLSRLVEHAPEPSVDIFLLHKMDMPHLVWDYERYGALTRPMAIHSIMAHRPNDADIEVLEQLNFAPHSSVMDVERTADGFRPVLSSHRYPANVAALVQVHHAAFQHACALLRSLTSNDLATMAKIETASAIKAIFGQWSGLISQFAAFAHYKTREEQLARQMLENAGEIARNRKMPVK